MEKTHTLDVRILDPRSKHPSIFEGFDKLKKDEQLTIINDHDPLPLFYQFKAERPDQFEWQYIEKGPQAWKVTLTKTKEAKTVADILLESPKAAIVFKKYHIDYCCKGKQLFEQACMEAGVDSQELKKQINLSEESPSHNTRPGKWSLDFLADFIVENHHQYIKDTTPDLLALSDKVKKIHGKEHPELLKMDEVINAVTRELIMHLQKEEQMIFPAIKELAAGESSGKYPFATVSRLIQAMEQEHTQTGAGFEKIRELTRNYAAPADACSSYRLLFTMLDSYEDDLHQHIHLENNILFRKTLYLENQS